VSDPKINIRSKPSPQPESSVKEKSAVALADSAVQTRAYELYQRGGRVNGGQSRIGTKQKLI